MDPEKVSMSWNRIQKGKSKNVHLFWDVTCGVYKLRFVSILDFFGLKIWVNMSLKLLTFQVVKSSSLFLEKSSKFLGSEESKIVQMISRFSAQITNVKIRSKGYDQKLKETKSDLSYVAQFYYLKTTYC